MATIVDAANCSAQPGAAGAWLVTKISGVDGAADASAVSTEAFAGDFLLRVRLVAGSSAFVGVSANPLAGHDHLAIERAVQIVGTLGRIYESGTFRAPSFGVVDQIWLRRTGSTLEYLTGDLATASAKRTVTGVTGAMRFDSSIANLGAQIEVKMDLPSAFARPRGRRSRLSLGFSI